MRTLIICSLLVLSAACFAQEAAPTSVVVGQNPDGENVMLTVIPLKFMDPVDAANILAALGFPGTVIPANPPRRPGESIGSYQGSGYGSGSPFGQGSRGGYQRGNRGNSYDGYGGYQDSGRRDQQNQGYQSPYNYR